MARSGCWSGTLPRVPVADGDETEPKYVKDKKTQNNTDVVPDREGVYRRLMCRLVTFVM